MTTFFLQLLAAWILLVVAHVSAMALAGVALGVDLREVSYGFGKELFSRGKLKIKAVPLGGYAKFGDTRETEADPPADPATAFNHKPVAIQAIIVLAGCAVLVLLAALVLAGASVSEVVEGFRQIVVGALGPKSTAQEYIHALYALSTTHGFPALLAVLATKVAAFNLLPLPVLNGGQALLAFVPTDRNVYPDWQIPLMNIGIVLMLALAGSWGFAILLFLAGGKL
ncbi:MAG TPA: site-2 protease family protein [Steroidobacter sp.]|uniref:site-2 protease family protein n=1 Tax=Steroidobacter sp. TaxID=1978227 RepID=UPI002EDACD71